MWKVAVDKFLDKWKERQEFVGAILSGSYAAGCPSPNSDIDVMLVLSEETKWSERGNLIIDGFMVEYIANPVSVWLKSFDENVNAGNKIFISMFALGKLLIDKDERVKQIIDKADELMKIPVKKMDSNSLEMAKYHMYDRLMKLHHLEKDGFPAYASMYYLHLNHVINTYANYLGVFLPASAKIYKFLNNSDFREKYQLEGFKDEKFVQLVNVCLENYIDLSAIDKLTQYILKKLGDFEINGWVLRTNIE